MHDVSKTMFEIWQGNGVGEDSPYETIELDRKSRKFINVKVVNVINKNGELIKTYYDLNA